MIRSKEQEFNQKIEEAVIHKLKEIQNTVEREKNNTKEDFKKSKSGSGNKNKLSNFKNTNLDNNKNNLPEITINSNIYKKLADGLSQSIHENMKIAKGEMINNVYNDCLGLFENFKLLEENSCIQAPVKTFKENKKKQEFLKTKSKKINNQLENVSVEALLKEVVSRQGRDNSQSPIPQSPRRK